MYKCVPITLVTGYLGSGKTTLINNILNNDKGYKMAVIVNDIGEVNIDADLIQKGGVSVNWEVKDKNDFRPEEGDMLSIHGHGRVLFYKIGGSSKKGRTFITLRRYI